MGFLDKLFGSTVENTELPKVLWNSLTNIEQLDALVEQSYEVPVLIFKHSTSCSISRFVLKQFENEYKFSNIELTPYFLDLLSYRDVSNEVAHRFNVVHQSPQIVVIKKGVLHYHTSHENIDAFKVKSIL